MIGGKKSETPSTTGSTDTSGNMESILGKGSEFEGKLKFEGTVRVDGKFKGEVQSKGTLIIGEEAMLEGDVDVDSAVVGGKVEGNITVKTRLELHVPAIVTGNITAPVLIIQEGVSFNGNCQTSKSGSNVSSPSTPKLSDVSINNT
ncbi:MAG: polymer-forming cytoskeletal protein [Gammaproteobacteria bacterium]|nr:polymer-forming cytoskeletal protein [Gammaproteobacteria bacterium]